ncbi:MAG: ABC transporter permease, partial [Halothermotrichaceae bacterium]
MVILSFIKLEVIVLYGRYIVKRILYAVITFMIIIFALSALLNTEMETTLKSQIAERIQGEFMAKDLSGLSSEEVTEMKSDRKQELYNMYHLDEPFINRTFWRAFNTITFNFGKSTHIKSSSGERDVFTIVMEKVPRTALLFTVAAFINVLISVFLGLKKAQKAGGKLDQSTTILTMLVYGMPSWWLGMILIMLLVYIIPIFPSGGIHSTPPPDGFFAYYLDMLYHMTLPVLTLVLIRAWGGAYLTRNIVLGTLQEDYIMSARARGINERKVLYGHTLRSSAPP